MTFKIDVVISHKGWDAPLTKQIYFQGDSLDDVMEKIKAENVPHNHLHNLKHYGKTAFKDIHGVKHKWVMSLMEGIN